MPNPSIVTDLILRDLTAPEVAKVAASIQQTLSGISVELPISPQAVQQTLRGVQGIAKAGKDASSSLISLAQVFKDPGLLGAYVEQRRALEALKADANRGISEFQSPREFLSMQDVLRDEQNYQVLLDQSIEKEKLRQKLRADVGAAVPRQSTVVAEGDDLEKQQARAFLMNEVFDEKRKRQAEKLHTRALVENAAFDKKREDQAKRSAAKILSVEEEAQKRLTEIRRREAVNRQVYGQLTPQERDALGKRLGRSGITIEHPFSSLVTKEGVGARFKSLFAGQVGSLIVYGTALRGTIALTESYFRANVELEDSLAKVSTVLEGSATQQRAQYAQLRESAIQWGRTHAQSAKDAADSMYYLLSAGQSVEEVQKNLPAVLNLSYGGFLEASFAAETAATAYELFSKQGLSMIDIVNRIQKTANITQVTVEQFASAFSYLASTADQLDLSFDEVNAAIGTLGTLGLRGSKGGRNLDEAFGQLLRKKGELAELGIVIEDDAGKLKTLGDILQAFREKLGSKIDVEELKLLREIFGQQGGRAFGLLIENTDLYLDTLQRVQTTQGDIFETAFKRGDTLSQLWERWKNQWQAIAQEGSVLQEVIKTLVGGSPAFRQRDFALTLLQGDQGSEAVKKGIEGFQQLTGDAFRSAVRKLRERFGAERLFTPELSAKLFGVSGQLPSDSVYQNLVENEDEVKQQLVKFFQTFASSLQHDESIENTRRVIADVLHINESDLKLFSFGPGDLSAISTDAKAFFTQVQQQIVADIGTGLVGPETGKALVQAVERILAGLKPDIELREVEKEVARRLASLRVNVSKAQLDALRSIKTEDFGKRLQIIDLELIVNIRKNKEEYLRQIEALPKEIRDNAKAYAEAKALLKKELSFKDLADENRAAADKIRLNLDIEFGDTAIARLRRDVQQALVEVARSVPDSVLTLQERLSLVDTAAQAETEKNFQEYLRKLQALPDEILLNAPRFEEAKAALQEALSMENLAARNRAFYEKDQRVRQEFIRSFEADIERQRRLQDLYLDQADAGDEQQRTNRNALLKQQLQGLSRELVPSPNLLLGPDDFGADIVKKIAAVTQIRQAIVSLNVVEATPETLAKVAEQIRVVGTEAGLSAEELDKFLQRLLGFDPQIQTTTDLVHSFTDAFGDLAGMMQVVGNDKTWSNIAKGVGLVDDTYTRVQDALDKIKGGKDLQGVLGITGAFFNAVGVIASMFEREEDRRNDIGIEEYKYEAGRNVSANYGRAQTINVQVDLNPNFNLLDASQLTQQRQREIAFELGDEIDNYFEETGRFTRN